MYSCGWVAGRPRGCTLVAAPSWLPPRGCPLVAAPSWLPPRGCPLVAAMPCRDAPPPETARPHPRTRQRAQVAPPACRPARSAFLGRGIGIADAHRAVRARAQHHAGFAPGAALLPAQAALVQG